MDSVVLGGLLGFEMFEIWRFIHTNLSRGLGVQLLTVVHSEGSAPGRQGFQMAVTLEGCCGTVGGGIMEFRLIERARSFLKNGNSPELFRQIHNRNAPVELQSGMICAGEQRIAFCPLSEGDSAAVSEMLSGKRGVWRISPEGLSFQAVEKCVDRRFVFESDGNWSYEEPAGCPETVYVAGCGHVGLAICRALAPLDFRVVAFDDREDAGTVRDNVFADEIFIRPYGEIGSLIREGARSYVVIVTSGFPSDVEALEGVIDKDLKYVGLMGSRAKLREIFRSLEERGVDRSLFERVRAPIGIGIANRTPGEIGVSVAAEIIQVKNGKGWPPGEHGVCNGKSEI